MSYFEKYEIERDYLYLNDLTKPRYEHVNGHSPIDIKDGINNIIEIDEDKRIKKDIESFYESSEKKHALLVQGVLQKKSLGTCINGIYIEDSNRDVNFIDYRNKFYDLINIENFTENENKKKILENIYEDSSAVVNLLNKKFTQKSKLDNIINVAKKLVNNIIKEKSVFNKKKDVNITTALAGGAVRDFLLGNENNIKDLDIVINFNDYTLGDVEKFFKQKNSVNKKNLNTYKEIESILHKQFEKKQKQNEVEIDGVKTQTYTDPFHNTDFAVTLKMFGVYLLSKDALEKNYDVEDFNKIMIDIFTAEFMNGDLTTNTGYKLLSDKTFGVLKLKHKKLKYPIDVSISNLDLSSFLEEFDLDICKASFILTQRDAQIFFPEKCEHLVSRFYSKPGFLYDVLSKKITYDIKKYEEDYTKKVLFEHLPRVKEKYKEYDINLWQSTQQAEDNLTNVKVLYNYENIKATLKENEVNNPNLNNNIGVTNLRKKRKL